MWHTRLWEQYPRTYRKSSSGAYSISRDSANAPKETLCPYLPEPVPPREHLETNLQRRSRITFGAKWAMANSLVMVRHTDTATKHVHIINDQLWDDDWKGLGIFNSYGKERATPTIPWKKFGLALRHVPKNSRGNTIYSITQKQRRDGTLAQAGRVLFAGCASANPPKNTHSAKFRGSWQNFVKALITSKKANKNIFGRIGVAYGLDNQKRRTGPGIIQRLHRATEGLRRPETTKGLRGQLPNPSYFRCTAKRFAKTHRNYLWSFQVHPSAQIPEST